MNRDVSFFNLSIKNILTKEQSPLDKARIHLLYYGFWICGVALIGFLTSAYFQHQTLLSITAATLLVTIIALFKYLTYRPHWQKISHTLLIIGTVVNFNTIFIALQKVDIITIQVILLIILFSYYMLGQTWGLFYSLLNLAPVLVFMTLYYYADINMPVQPERLDESTTIISVFANFILIIYIHSHFYGAFLNNIRELKENGEKQKALNSELELAKQKAEKSSRIKSDFLATMSHEIRTPLNAIVGMSNVMLMNNPRKDQKENIDLLKLSANNLMSIVNDVLDFNKIESGTIEFERIKFSLVELIDGICGGERLKAEEKGLVFATRIDPFLADKQVIGDPIRTGQVLFNLVSNAIKFTHQGNIWVTVTSLMNPDHSLVVTFCVKDTGIGIDPNDLETIFEPFTQESITSTRKYGGTGMGLAIVKRLLDLQGLQMDVNSKVGKGSEFSFSMTFPIAEANAADLLNEADALASLKMLVAEDNPVNVLLMQKLLSKWKITPVIAGDGGQALEMARNNNFDIILMDLQMPVMSGFDAAAEIRKLPDARKASTPIIAMTAAGIADMNTQIANAGINDYMSKPFKPKDLLEKIHLLVAVS